MEFSVADRDYRLASAGGVFSAGRLDPGTAVLLRKAELPAADTSGDLLDLGCGYGPISLRAGRPSRPPAPSGRSTSTRGPAS